MNIIQKILKNGLKTYIAAIPYMIVNHYDEFCDKKVCGRSLVNTIPTKFKYLGATNSQPSHWLVLKELFKGSEFTSNDKIIDIGCGQGRVIAFLIKNKFPGEIHGIEIDSDIAKICIDWAKKYNNVSIINGNAFEHDYNQYTILFMGRPLEHPQFIKFIEKLENEINHPITLYHNWSTPTEEYLKNRKGWCLTKSQTYLKKWGLPLAGTPQKFSIFSYTPQNN